MTSTQAVRRIPLAGTYNLRDTGGYPVGDRATRWGALLRSDALHKVDQDGRNALRDLNLGLVIDLRQKPEAESAPNALDGVGHRAVLHPVYETVDTHAPGFGLSQLYRQMITEHAAALTSVVRLIATSGPGPTLVHCTAGKDRTGLVVALALAAVGVDERDIIADYALSETMLAGEWAAGMIASYQAMGLPADLDMGEMVYGSPASLMRETLALIQADHSDARGFLRAHGMTDDELAALTTRLVA